MSKTQNWTPHDKSSSSKFTAIVSRSLDVNDPMTLSHPRFTCLLFIVCTDYDVLMQESKYLWIICGLEWRVGCWWHQSVQVFVFSSIVAFVSNSSIKAAIFIQHLGCLNVENWLYNYQHRKTVYNFSCLNVENWLYNYQHRKIVYNFKCNQAGQTAIFLLHTRQFCQCPGRFKDYGGYLLFLHMDPDRAFFLFFFCSVSFSSVQFFSSFSAVQFFLSFSYYYYKGSHWWLVYQMYFCWDPKY